MLIVFNFPGLGMILAGGLAAFAASKLFGLHGEPALMIPLGVVSGALDIVYRLHRARETTRRDATLSDRAVAMGLDWVRPSRGGSLFFVPIWAFGALWIALGIGRLAGGG